jgi:CheY-like chemotaxis protein
MSLSLSISANSISSTLPSAAKISPSIPEPIFAQVAVLIIEDQVVNAKSAAYSLSKFIPSNSIVWVNCAEQAQAALKGFEFIAKQLPSKDQKIHSIPMLPTLFNVALIDFDLNSTLSGREVTKHVRLYEQLNKKFSTVILTYTTHYSRKEILNKEDELIFNGIMPKPFIADDITSKIKQYIPNDLWSPIASPSSSTPRPPLRSLSIDKRLNFNELGASSSLGSPSSLSNLPEDSQESSPLCPSIAEESIEIGDINSTVAQNSFLIKPISSISRLEESSFEQASSPKRQKV